MKYKISIQSLMYKRCSLSCLRFQKDYYQSKPYSSFTSSFLLFRFFLIYCSPVCCVCCVWISKTLPEKLPNSALEERIEPKPCQKKWRLLKSISSYRKILQQKKEHYQILPGGKGWISSLPKEMTFAKNYFFRQENHAKQTILEKRLYQYISRPNLLNAKSYDVCENLFLK